MLPSMCFTSDGSNAFIILFLFLSHLKIIRDNSQSYPGMARIGTVL